jgi:hypothetical protein
MSDVLGVAEVAAEVVAYPPEHVIEPAHEATPDDAATTEIKDAGVPVSPVTSARIRMSTELASRHVRDLRPNIGRRQEQLCALLVAAMVDGREEPAIRELARELYPHNGQRGGGGYSAMVKRMMPRSRALAAQVVAQLHMQETAQPARATSLAQPQAPATRSALADLPAVQETARAVIARAAAQADGIALVEVEQ